MLAKSRLSSHNWTFDSLFVTHVTLRLTGDREMEPNEPREQKWGRQRSRQQAKHAKLYSDLLEACKKKVQLIAAVESHSQHRFWHLDTLPLVGQTDRQTGSQAGRQADRDRQLDRQTETQRERDRQTDRQRQRDRDTDRQTDTETERQRETEIDWQGETETQRDRERQTNRDRDTQRDRQTQRERSYENQ